MFFQVHRLVIVDDHEVVKGIVSLSDILQALVLTNGDNGKTTRFKVHLNHFILSQTFLQCSLLVKIMFPCFRVQLDTLREVRREEEGRRERELTKQSDARPITKKKESASHLILACRVKKKSPTSLSC